MISFEIVGSGNIEETHDAVPKRSVVPKDNVLFLVRMCIDVLRLEDRAHDPESQLVTAGLRSSARVPLFHEQSNFSEVINYRLLSIGAIFEVQLENTLSVHL